MAEALIALAGLAAVVPAGLRWLRVAQREHYLAGGPSRFAWRWWTATPLNVALALLGLAGLAAALWWPPAGLAAALAAALGPVGLGVRGRTAPLAWTARLRRLAALAAGLAALVFGAGLVAGRPDLGAVLAAAAMAALVDGALLAARPVEVALARPWLRKADGILERVDPVRVAITGSYGKTTTKEYVRHLIARHRTVVASPASFNNAMGLARTVNEHLAPGTEVFIAEMGTYGPGEIADLVGWVRPQVSVITAIGPVHLERFRSEDRIVAAKSEIFAGAAWAVLNVDEPRLAAVADTLAAEGRNVVRCSVAGSGDVAIRQAGHGYEIVVRGAVAAPLAELPPFPVNAACAIGVLVALGLPLDGIGDALAALRPPEHRQTGGRSEAGFTYIDDTYNSNPAGARAALQRLADSGGEGATRVVVTPGMVELGPRQAEENAAFAQAAAEVADHLVVVGRTNRRALLAGAAAGGVEVITVEDRDAAVSWVRSHLGDGDAVLYENDLPDHYP